MLMEIMTAPSPPQGSSVKPWWQSRTIRLNVAVVVLAVAESQLNIIQPLLPVNFYAAVAFALPIINAAMRIITTQAVSMGGQS